MSESIANILDFKKYTNDRSLAFDFSLNSDITIIDFNNSGGSEPGRMDWDCARYVRYYGANYVSIYGSGSRRSDRTFIYRFCIDGLPGFDLKNDPFYLSSVLYELVIKRNNSKYVIFLADCAGAYNALWVSQNMPVNAMILTNPAIAISTTAFIEFGFTADKLIGYAVREKAFGSSSVLKQHTDAFPILMQCKNLGIKIDCHWPKYPIKSDAIEKQRVTEIKNKNNLNIIEHDIPKEVNPHHLYAWLNQTSKYYRYVKDEVNMGKIFVNALKGIS